MRALIVCLLIAGCGGDQHFVIVKVDKRDSVRQPGKLKVTLSNAGSERSDELDLGGRMLPLSFSISAPGREGTIGISIDGLDAAGLLVGRGAGETTVDATADATVLLDPADFVVNTTVAGS